MKAQHILAIDHGTSGIKASIIDLKGRVQDFEFVSTPVTYLPDGGAEQDPELWWQALLKASRTLIKRKKVSSKQITAICVSSTFSSTVAVDKHGHHLMNSLTWMDSRGRHLIKKIMGGFPSIDGYNLFKVLQWIPRTAGGPALSGKDDIAHVLYTMHELPEIYDQTFMFLPSKDYLNLRLTGKFASSYDAMHLFWVTNVKDINNPHYDEKLIKLAGIDRKKLPEMKHSTDILGTLKCEVAKELGLDPHTKVVMGSADHQAALIGSGAVNDFEGHVYIGTSSWLQCVVPFKKTDMFHSIASFPAAIPGKFQSVNEQDIAGGALVHLVEQILYHENRLLKGEPPENIYAELDAIAAQVPAGSGKVIFTPWLNGERTPVDDTLLRAGIYNISHHTTQDHLVRALLEGVAYNTRWSLQYVEKFAGRRLTPLNIIGGGGRSDVWCQIFADVMNREIRQVADPMQANARGAAFIAGVGLGELRFEDIPNLIEYNKSFIPNPDNRKIYDTLFNEFVTIYKNNKAMYKRLNSCETC